MSLIERLRRNELRIDQGINELCGTAANALEAADRMAEALEDCSNDLEAEVQDRLGYDERLKRQLNRDMATVIAARNALAAYRATQKDD